MTVRDTVGDQRDGLACMIRRRRRIVVIDRSSVRHCAMTQIITAARVSASGTESKETQNRDERPHREPISSISTIYRWLMPKVKSLHQNRSQNGQ